MASGRWSVYLCAVISATLYLNSLNGEFVFDDHEAIETNTDVRLDTPLSQVFSNDFWGLPLSDPESHKSYRPLVVLSFRLNRLIHGLWTPGFHAVNIALHSLVCVLYHWMMCCCLAVDWSTATVASLLFAVHPIHTEAVSNIVGRTELLSAVFFILSFFCYHYALPHTSQRRLSSHSLPLIALSVCSSVVSMLCKEQGVTVLGVCLVYDLVLSYQFGGSQIELLHIMKVIRRWISSRMRGIRSKRRSSELPRWLNLLIQRALILTLSAFVIVICRLYVNGRGNPHFVESDNPASFSDSFLTRTMTYSYLVVINVWLLLCPSRLCFDWSMGSVPLVEELNDLRNISTLSLLSAFLVLLLWTSGFITHTCRAHANSHVHYSATHTEPSVDELIQHTPSTPAATRSIRANGVQNFEGMTTKRHRALVVFSLSLALLPFLPASNLFFPVGFVVAERVLYLPSMGVCLLVAIGWSRLKFIVPCLRTLVTLFLLLSVATFSVKTVVRNADWRNTESLAKSAVPINPGNAKVFMTLGTFYTQLGQRRCELFYKEALRLRPSYTAAWTNLGLVLLNTERPVEAESCYRKALSIKSDHINANINMGHLCRLQQRWEEASQYYEMALQRRPQNTVARYYLGVAQEKIGRAENIVKAEKEFGRVVELQPGHWESHAALAQILATTTTSGRRVQYGFTKGRRLDLAVHHYREALLLKPGQADARYALSKILAFKGELEQAKLEMLTVLKLAPDHTQAHYELGALYEQLGDKIAALLEFQAALRVDPTSKLTQQKIKELSQT